jgi:hypothetical protein
MTGMCCDQKVYFRMAGMGHGQKVSFSMVGMSHGQKVSFNLAGMGHGQKVSVCFSMAVMCGGTSGIYLAQNIGVPMAELLKLSKGE